MRRKTARYRIADVKAVPPEGSGEGVVEAVVAVFGNVDLVGDRIVKGAFQKSLARWKASGDPVPLIFDHQWSNLDAHAGEVLEAEELEPGDERLPEAIKDLGGLWIKAMLDLEDDFARRLFNKLKRRRIREWSFAYDVVEEREAKDANELVELELIEVGPTLKGANPATQLIDVKSAKSPAEVIASLEAAFTSLKDPESVTPEDMDAAVEAMQEATALLSESQDDEPPSADDDDDAKAVTALVKAGRVLSTKNEGKIREAVGLLSEVLESVQKEDEDGGKSLGPSEQTMTPQDLALRVQILEYEAAS